MVSHFDFDEVVEFWQLLDAVVQASESSISLAHPTASEFIFTGLARNTMPLVVGEGWLLALSKSND